MTEYYAGQKLKKLSDNRIVTINFVGDNYLRIDGDAQPNHTVLKEKVEQRYMEVKK